MQHLAADPAGRDQVGPVRIDPGHRLELVRCVAVSAHDHDMVVRIERGIAALGHLQALVLADLRDPPEHQVTGLGVAQCLGQPLGVRFVYTPGGKRPFRTFRQKFGRV